VHRSSPNGSYRIARIATVVLGSTGAWFLIARRGDLFAAIGSVASLGPETLPIGLGLVALGVANRGVQARAGYRLVGLHRGLGPMVELSASSYATNKVVKSCGAAGLVPFLADARERGHSRVKVVAAYVSTKVVETLSLCALVAIAVVAGATTGALRGATLVGAAASLAYALVVVVGLGVLATRHSAVLRIGALAQGLASRLRATFRRPPAEPKPSAAHEIADTIHRLRSDPAGAVPLLLTAFVGKLLGVACLALVFGGLGIHLGLVTTLLAYTLTLMASLVGPFPGGIGVAEASLGALLVSHGVAAASAAAAVVAFRLLDLWLPLLAGVVAELVRSRRRARARAGHRTASPSAPRTAPRELVSAWSS
jgi:uncharacterized protein (TIRG00374 family)